MQPITYFSKKQKLCEDWITEMGFKVRAEVDVEQYRVDLLAPEICMVVEIDGPSHRKMGNNGTLITLNSEHKVSKRDKVLLSHYQNGVWHVPVGISEEIFKAEFKKIIGAFNDEKRTE
jgi:hypothetical protein